MNKPFFLFAGPDYYPRGGMRDFKNCFSSRESAKEAVTETKHQLSNTATYTTYEIGGESYDWIQIVDIRDKQ